MLTVFISIYDYSLSPCVSHISLLVILSYLLKSYSLINERMQHLPVFIHDAAGSSFEVSVTLCMLHIKRITSLFIVAVYNYCNFDLKKCLCYLFRPFDFSELIISGEEEYYEHLMMS